MHRYLLHVLYLYIQHDMFVYSHVVLVCSLVLCGTYIPTSIHIILHLHYDVDSVW